MKLAIASDNGVDVACHGIHARGFIVYEIEDRSARRVEFRQCEAMKSPSEAQRHAGPRRPGPCFSERLPLLDALHGCAALIARNLPRAAGMDLEARGIQVFNCGFENADRVARMFLEGKLSRRAMRVEQTQPLAAPRPQTVF